MTEGRRKIFIRDAHTHTLARLMNIIKSERSQQIEATIEQVDQKSAKQAQNLANSASNLT